MQRSNWIGVRTVSTIALSAVATAACGGVPCEESQ